MEDWDLSIDLKLPKQSTSVWKNVFGVQVEGAVEHYWTSSSHTIGQGARLPAVWILRGKEDIFLHITYN